MTSARIPLYLMSQNTYLFKGYLNFKTGNGESGNGESGNGESGNGKEWEGMGNGEWETENL